MIPHKGWDGVLMKTNRESNLRRRIPRDDLTFEGLHDGERRQKGKSKRFLGKWSRRQVKKDFMKSVNDAKYV